MVDLNDNNQISESKNNRMFQNTSKFYKTLKNSINDKVVMSLLAIGFVSFLMSASYIDKEMNFLFFIFNTILFVSFAAILNSHWFKFLNIETSYRFKDNIFRDVIISVLCFGIAVEAAFSSTLFVPIFGKVISTTIMLFCYLWLVLGFAMTCHILILKHDIIENRNDRKVHKTSKSEAEAETNQTV